MRTATLQIAFRNFTRNSRRFLLLGLAVTAGFLFLCIVQGLVAGLSLQINMRGARYYGGNVIISRLKKAPAPATVAEEERLIQAGIAQAGVRPSAISHRTRFDTDGIAFFNGESVRTRRIVGMDWSAEGSLIKRLEFVSGRPDDMSDPNGALISEVTARRLGARVGDKIVLQVNRNGIALYTIPVVVKAIFREVSIFGFYTVYMDRAVLDQALGFPTGYSASVGLYLDDYRSAGRVAFRLNHVLDSRYTAEPVISFMEEVRTLLEALTAISYGILALLVVVIAVGILNLYRVIIYERTREIGTMRAIGLQRTQVRNIIFFEALFLALCSIGVGLVLSVVVLSALSLLHFAGAAGFDIFLDRGHLSWVLYADDIARDAILITLVTLVRCAGAGPVCAIDRARGSDSSRMKGCRMRRRIMTAWSRTGALCLLIGCSVALLGPRSAGAQGSRAPDSMKILRNADALVTFSDTDFSALYSFEQGIPGQGTSSKQAMVFRRDKDNEYLIVITKPQEDRGKGYLKSGDNLWFYDPVSRRFTFTSAKDRFQNMNARNSDFTRSNLPGDYKVTAYARQKLGKFDCWLFDLQAVSDDITFPKMKIWISDDGLVRKTEDYSYPATCEDRRFPPVSAGRQPLYSPDGGDCR